MKEIIFLIIALFTVGSAVYVAFSQNIIYTAYTLLITLSGIAGFYVLLGADFLAGIQLLLYVGGILVLILFAVMLSSDIGSNYKTNPSRGIFPSFVITALFLAGNLWVIWNTNWAAVLPGSAAGYGPTTRVLGNDLLTRYVLPFEVISILLLVGLIGAVSLSRVTKRISDEQENGKGEEGRA